MSDEYLKLDNQLCFAVYALSREIVKLYTPLLDAVGLTYTQYVTLLVLWEHSTISFRDLGQKLHLDSGTLTPLIRKLEQQGYVTKCRSAQDERVVDVTLTAQGHALKERVRHIPAQLFCDSHMEPAEAIELKQRVQKALDSMTITPCNKN